MWTLKWLAAATCTKRGSFIKSPALTKKLRLQVMAKLPWSSTWTCSTVTKQRTFPFQICWACSTGEGSGSCCFSSRTLMRETRGPTRTWIPTKPQRETFCLALTSDWMSWSSRVTRWPYTTMTGGSQPNREIIKVIIKLFKKLFLVILQLSGSAVFGDHQADQALFGVPDSTQSQSVHLPSVRTWGAASGIRKVTSQIRFQSDSALVVRRLFLGF